MQVGQELLFGRATGLYSIGLIRAERHVGEDGSLETMPIGS